MLKKILVAVAAIIAVFTGVIAMQPAEFRIERSTKVDAPASALGTGFQQGQNGRRRFREGAGHHENHRRKGIGKVIL